MNTLEKTEPLLIEYDQQRQEGNLDYVNVLKTSRGFRKALLSGVIGAKPLIALVSSERHENAVPDT